MENRSHALIAGLFTLFLGAAAVLSLWWFGGRQEATDDYIVATTGNVTGLNVQAQVRYRGMRVGRVLALDLDPADAGTTLIRIRIRKGIPITRGTIARLGSQGVTGIAHILLEETDKNAPALTASGGAFPRIQMRDSLSLQELAGAGTETLNRLKDLLTTANEILDPESRKNISRILGNLESTSDNAREISARLRALVTPENIRRLNSTLARAEQTVGQAAPFFAEARELVARLQRVGEKLDLALGASSSGSGASALRLNELGAELSTSLRDLNRLMQRLEESPQSLLFGYRKNPGPGEPGFAVSDKGTP